MGKLGLVPSLIGFIVRTVGTGVGGIGQRQVGLSLLGLLAKIKV